MSVNKSQKSGKPRERAMSSNDMEDKFNYDNFKEAPTFGGGRN